MSDSSAANVAINASPELPACFAPGDQGLLGLRLGGLFGILVVSTIGVFIPFFTYKAKLASVYFLLRAFAAGVVLTTGCATENCILWHASVTQQLAKAFVLLHFLCHCGFCLQVCACSRGRVSDPN